MAQTQIVTYLVDDSTVVSFEIEPVDGFRPASAGNAIAVRVQDAVGPAVDAARVVLDKVKEACPDEIELKFGVKVSGGASWLVARAAAEGSFEITLTWSPGARQPAEDPGTPKMVSEPQMPGEPESAVTVGPSAVSRTPGEPGTVSATPTAQKPG